MRSASTGKATACADALTACLPGLSMRRLGAAFGIESMSLCEHVADKDAVLDGLTHPTLTGPVGLTLYRGTGFMLGHAHA
jgi:hypothetical protein